MNLLPLFKNNLWRFKATFASWLLRSGIKPTIIYASDSKFVLSLFFGTTSRKNRIGGCFTSAEDVLAYLSENEAGILATTLSLDDISGDELIQQVKTIRPNLRCILIAENNNYTASEAESWRSPVIVAAQDIGDESEPWRVAMLSAIANTTYRSKSIQQQSEVQDPSKISLTPREQDILQCFAMGLTNVEAAERLKLSPHSTKTYSKRLMAKLNVNNRQLALLKVFGTNHTALQMYP